MMLQIFIDLRNFFYTRSSKKSGNARYGYKLSMSALFIPYYFILLAVINILSNRFTDFRLIEFLRNDENLLREIIKDVAFWIPLVVMMLILFRILRKYDPALMEKKDEKKWLSHCHSTSRNRYIIYLTIFYFRQFELRIILNSIFK